MSSEKLTVAILVVSETASKDASTDRCIPALQETITTEGNGQWVVVDEKIVPDNVLDIQRYVTQWTDSDSNVNLILTSGGTGFATKDVTPEAVSPLIHKHAPGLVHGMLSASMQVTPFAVMSRPVAGVRNSTLIITLPGSPKGAKENLQSILKMLPHACKQARGDNSRIMHKGGTSKLEKDAGLAGRDEEQGISVGTSRTHQHDHHHHHHHHHGHGHDHGHGGHHGPQAHTTPSTRPAQSNDPSLGPSRRHRSSPYEMLSVEAALSQIATHVPSPSSHKVPLSSSVVGHVLAADVKAAESVPAFRASIVDGYAICIPSESKSNTKGTFPVAFASHAQGADVPPLEEGKIARITTGAPLPPGASAVVMVEDTVLHSLTPDGREEAEVEILTSDIKPGENVREAGSDVQAGDVVMRAGEGISAVGGEFGLLASVGTKEVTVYKKPVVGVLSTGDEIVAFNREGGLRLGEVRDTNRPTLLTAVAAQGFEVVDLGVASDKADTLESTLRNALTRVDLLITTGGVSMGELDLLKPTIERALGGTIHFGRVSMKPGKPTTFATIPGENIKDPASGSRGAATANGKKVVFSLPGNPASAVVTFMLFVLPALHTMSGIQPVGLPVVKVRLESAMKCDDKREEYARVVVTAKSGTSGEESGLWAVTTGGQRSSRIGSFKGANALVRLPTGGGMLEKGAWVDALVMGQAGGVADMM